MLYEAMAMRLPIVSSNVGGIPYTLENKKNALLFECGDIKQMAEAICLVIEDDSLRKDIIRDASKILNGVFAKMDGSQIATLYARCVQR